MVPEKLSAIRRCPLFGVSAIGRFLKYSIYGKRSWYIAHCPLYGRCPLFGVSAKRGSTVYSYASLLMPHCPVTVVQRYRDGVCSLLFHSFFIICHPYIPLHLLVLPMLWTMGRREQNCSKSSFHRSVNPYSQTDTVIFVRTVYQQTNALLTISANVTFHIARRTLFQY